MGDKPRMPWKRGPMEQREELIGLIESGAVPVGEACELYGVSRKTGYKWLSRRRDGSGLEDRSRAPRSHPNALAHEVVEQIVALKTRYPRMGPKKIRALMQAGVRRGQGVPAASTIFDVLERRGLNRDKPKSQSRQPRAGRELRPVEGPNDTWCIDFKGEFRLGDGRLCYPLTVTDAFSRYLLDVRGLTATRYDLTRRSCEKLFERRGLPAVMRSDGGVPFFGRGPGCVSQLSVWWMKLGIHCERVGRPQDNGQHERMHRTLKQHTARPPSGSMSAQQRRFDAFRAHFNDVRPHEALQMRSPSSAYKPSKRRTLTERTPEYPKHFEVRQVAPNGMMRWKKRQFFVSEALCTELLGIEEIDQGMHRVSYGSLLLGFLVDAREELGLIHPNAKCLEKVLPMSPVRL
jgi:putative transposase